MRDIVNRLTGALLLGTAGAGVGWALTPGESGASAVAIVLVLTLLGAALGMALFPIILRMFGRAGYGFRAVTLFQTGLAMLGLIGGLIVSALLVPVYSNLPDPADWIAPLVTAAIAGPLGALLLASRSGELSALAGPQSSPRNGSNGFSGKHQANGRKLVVDTSAIIDGRIADISEAGFIQGSLVLPRFVLDELRHIADSPEALRRNRGRRGLDILNRLQKESPVPIEITDVDFEDVPEVDSKLVRLASMYGCPILTNDFNLNRVAELEGVPVLNINQLANAVKSVVLPGEEMVIRVIQEGKDAGQGVGFLDDGTMVVVESGRRHLNDEVGIVVTRVLQTVAGRMIFAQLKGNG
jgi:uncharacterized protein YacL